MHVFFFLKASDSLHLTTQLLCNSKPDRTRLSQNGSWLRQQTTWERPPSPLWLSGSLFDRHLPWMLALPGSSSLLMLLQDHLSTGPTAVAHIVSSSVSSGFQLELHLIWMFAFHLVSNRTLSAATNTERREVEAHPYKPTFTQQIIYSITFTILMVLKFPFLTYLADANHFVSFFCDIPVLHCSTCFESASNSCLLFTEMKYLNSNCIFTLNMNTFNLPAGNKRHSLPWLASALFLWIREEMREYKGAQTTHSPPPALQLTVRELQTVGFIFANDANKHSPPHCVKCKRWSLQCVSYSVDGWWQIKLDVLSHGINNADLVDKARRKLTFW